MPKPGPPSKSESRYVKLSVNIDRDDYNWMREYVLRGKLERVLPDGFDMADIIRAGLKHEIEQLKRTRSEDGK